MKVLVTGITGQLGFDIMKQLKEQSYDVIGVSSKDMDITDKKQVNSVIREAYPDIVIHCAAYTAVDNAEDDIEICNNVNHNGTKYIAEVCGDLNIKMVYFSTDYVFDGEGNNAWTEKDEINPLNVYGNSKYLGELEVIKSVEKFFILRISWVFGINGKNFIKTMINLSKNHDTISVVDDQIGSPTYTYDLAKLVIDIIKTEKYGVYHVTNEGYCSWYEFATEIFNLSNIKVNVKPIPSEQFKTKAKRPKNSRMSKDKLYKNGFEKLPHWKNALERYLKELEVINE